MSHLLASALAMKTVLMISLPLTFFPCNQTLSPVFSTHLNTLHLTFAEQQSLQLTLKRFPHNRFDKSLRAWDAADEYLLSHLVDNADLSELTTVAVVNDSFGALSCALLALMPNINVHIYTDSHMSSCAIQHNLAANQLEPHRLTVMSSLELHAIDQQAYNIVLVKVPRTLAYLEYIVDCVCRLRAKQQTTIVAAGMVKLVTSSCLKLFDKYFSDTRTSLAKKKARLIFADTPNTPLPTLAPTHVVEDRCIPFSLHNYPNVFCREQIDIGARFILEHLPLLNEQQTIIDLGCGNGILGISLLVQASKQQLKVKVIFVDESHMALASAKASLDTACEQGLVAEHLAEQAQFKLDHCLQDYLSNKDAERCDTIVCNPPFHQQNAVLDDIAWTMFEHSKRALKLGGELLVVGNRHLDHKRKLAKLFGGSSVVANNNKFILLSAKK